MHGFRVLKGSVNAGSSTKAEFSLHPFAKEKLKGFQFILLGTDRTDAIRTQRPIWGTNGAFGGPMKMNPSSALPTALTAADCTASGISFSEITGFTWKGYLTPEIANRGAVGKTVIVQAGVKALAVSEDAVANIAGVTGQWIDDGDLNVDGDDTFVCMGIAVTDIFVNA